MSVALSSTEKAPRRRQLAYWAWLALGLVVARQAKPSVSARREQTLPPKQDLESGAEPKIGEDADHAAVTPAKAERVAAAEPERGRTADKPAEIPARGWKDIVWRTVQEMGQDDVATMARSIAFSGLLAMFPALAGFVSIYGLFADVGAAREHMAALTGIIPAEAATFIGEQMVRIAAQQNASLGLTFLLSLVLSIWSANAGMKALFKGLNVAYDETEKRGFLKLNIVTLSFTLGGIVFLALAMGATVVAPVLFAALGFGGMGEALALLRWPILLVVTVLALGALYRYGPSRDKPKWRWVSWGSGLATLLWIASSMLFSWYLANFANYNETYGSLGAVFGFMIWLWLSAVVVLFGAELNAEMEHQTAKDTTEGPNEPLGARGAIMADTVGAAKTGSMLPKIGRGRGG